MNNKITFPELVDKIAELTNTSKRVSELFLKELFGVIKERLEQGESVKIKNLGTFKVTEIATRKSVNVNTGEEMEIPSHRRVSFTPDKSLAEAVNTPFEGFETIVLDDDITEKELEISAECGIGSEELGMRNAECGIRSEELGMRNAECGVRNEELEVESKEEEILPPVFVEKEEEVISVELGVRSEECDDSVELGVRSEECDDSVELGVRNEECDDSEELGVEGDVRSEKRKSFIWGFLGGIVTFIVIGCIAIAVCDNCFGDFVPYSEKGNVAATVITSEELTGTAETMSDTITQKVVEPVTELPTVVTDTVRVNYYLTKMSRKYYGRYEFWVYIYEENKDKIKNPNKVAPGLVVVIPPASKYGIDKNDPESVAKAKKMAEKMQ